ncbi:MAG TPA: hypothetical protein VF953_01015 [Terriglobales bacterium]
MSYVEWWGALVWFETRIVVWHATACCAPLCTACLRWNSTVRLRLNKAIELELPFERPSVGLGQIGILQYDLLLRSKFFAVMGGAETSLYDLPFVDGCPDVYPKLNASHSFWSLLWTVVNEVWRKDQDPAYKRERSGVVRAVGFEPTLAH